MANELTFVLTDVESSTILWERYPDQMSVAIASHEEIIADAVASHGGELIRERGEGDSTFAVFTDPRGAVAAAAKMGRALAKEPWSHQAPIRVRISVYTGEVESRDGDYYGTTVNRAARVRSLAFGGQVLLGETTADAVASELPDATALLDLGPRELKDLAAPERVFELRLLDADAPPEPLSDIDASNNLWMERLLSSGFVDRDRERRTLIQAWAAAASGDRSLVLVEGEPGIGKTSIAAAVAHHVVVDGGMILYGRWDEEFLAPFQAFREALGSYARLCPRSILRADLREHGDEISRLFPEVAKSIDVDMQSIDGTVEAERLRLFEAIDAWLSAISSRRPVCLVLDDLHWADRPSFLLLLHLMRAPVRIPLFIVATYRGDVAAAGDAARFIPDLTRHPNVQRVSLSGLGRSDIEDLMHHISGTETRAPGLAEELRTETGGNPLFLREVVQHLAELDALDIASRRGIELPDSVRELVRWRLRPLNEDTREALSIASVIGHEFDAEVLATASGLKSEGIPGALEESRRAGVLHDVGEMGERYAFSHAIVRRALLDDLSGARRAGFHHRIGEALEQRRPHAPAGQLAHHFCAAVTSERADKAIAYARDAAADAMRELAFEVAILHLRRALEIQQKLRPDDLVIRCELLGGLGAAHDRAGEYADRVTCFREMADIARRLDRADLFADAALGLGGGALPAAADPNPEVIALLEEALERLPDGDSRKRALVLGRLAHALQLAPPRSRRVQLSDQAVAMMRRLGDPRGLAEALIDRSFALDGPDDLDEQLRTADEIKTLSQSVGDRMSVLRALHLRTDGLFEAGRFADLHATLEEMRSIAQELRFPEYLRVVRAWDSVFAGIEGRFDEAAEIAGDVRAMLLAMDHPQTERDYQALLFPGLWLRGGLIDTLPVYESLAEALPERMLLHMVVGWVTSEAGMDDRARRALDTVGVDILRDLDHNFMWWTTMVGLTTTATLLADEEWAAPLYELMLPFADRLATAGSSTFIGSARYHLGALATTLERYDEGAEHFEHAIVRSIEMRGRPWLAMAQASYAAMLTARGAPQDAERASELRRDALAVADELGLRAVKRRLGL